MRHLIQLLLAFLFWPAAVQAEPVKLTATDGVQVHGEFWPAAGDKAPLILAFHQAGASHSEYGPLAPRLNQAGFSVLAIDQRSGGGEFGGKNRTVAALVFVLAARHPDELQGLLAFSPGEYLGSATAVRSAGCEVRVPVFITQSSDQDEIDAARGILAATAGSDKTLFEPARRGVHGSSTLRSDRNAVGAEENWAAVLAFLGKFKTAR